MANSRICSIPGCGNPHYGKSLCNKHYQRLRFHGDPLYVPPAHIPKVCSVDACNSQAVSLGFCKTHYYRQYRHGDPLAGGTSPGECLAWLLDHVAHEGDDCLKWPYAVRDDGYGKLQIDGKLETATRVMCEKAHGPAPSPSHQAAHKCGKGHEGCINPEHLYWATPPQNAHDRIAHGTANRGERHGMAKLTADAVLEIKSKPEVGDAEYAEKFGVSPATIKDVRRGRRWGWLSP